MKNVNLRKMTAFAAALALAAQNGMAVINAEETADVTVTAADTEQTSTDTSEDTVTPEVPAEDEKPAESSVEGTRDDPVIKSILKDSNGGKISDSRLAETEYVELNGKYFSEPMTSLGVLKKTSVSTLVLKDMRDFDLAMLKDLKSLKSLSIEGMVTVKNIEALGELDLTYIKVDSLGAEHEPFVRKEDVYPYIKCQDITVTKGELKGFTTSPEFYPGYGGENRLYYECEDTSVALLANDTMAGEFCIPEFCSSAIELETYVYGLKEGETTYTLKDREGNLIGKAKITVTAADELNDPALVKAKAKPVKVINSKSYVEAENAYILYDNGSLYTFNDGDMKECQKNIKDAALNDSGIYTLSEDGVIYVNGNAVNDPAEYTVVSANNYLTYIFCSDGCIRTISDGKAEKYLENIKTMDENFGCNHAFCGIVKSTDGTTSIVYRDKDGKGQYYPLEEKFEPVSISMENPTMNGGLYYVRTADNKIYKISAVFPVKNIPGLYDHLADTVPSATVELYSENAVQKTAEDQTEIVNSNFRVYDLKDKKDNSICTFTQYTISNNELYYSVRDNEGGETYNFVKDAKPVTHVKLNYGIYKHGGNRCVLIQREDNTLWKYIIETGELARVDEAVTGSEVLEAKAPETPEETKPEEGKPSENENKDTESKETAPSEDKEKETEPKESAPAENKEKETGPKESAPAENGEKETEPKESAPAENGEKETEPKESAPSENGNKTTANAGDLSSDGKVDVTDLTILSLGLLGDFKLTETQRQAADVNHDGKVDLADLATLRQFLSKKISSLA